MTFGGMTMFRLRIAALSLLTFAVAAGQSGAQAKPKKVMTDEDVPAIGGTGAPIGYSGRTDRPAQKLSDAKYVKVGNGWEVTTGPAHILYKATDVASGSYTVSATIDQLAKPVHPESYGIFVGGRGLDGPTQTYLYFLVRGSGDILAKTRTGDKTGDVLAWQPGKKVPKEDAAGKASYKLGIQVSKDSVKFWVNSVRVGAVAKGTLPTEGVFGLRINHNLHVHATPVSIKR
jgi:hypothetical protein